MKILVIGSGGREHTIIWKLKQNQKVTKVYCAPGNGGISQLAECVPINAMEIEKVVEFAQRELIDMVVVAPDDPLAAGMVDALENAGIRAFGPNKAAAIIESSKVFSKDLMRKYNIPSAGYEVFKDYALAINYVKTAKLPLVVKADGLALGKGVLICNTKDEAMDAVTSIMKDKQFGSAGETIVVEEFLTGPEVSVLAFTDGKTIIPMVSSQDHKRAYDNDQGLNTGGMGAFTPSRFFKKELEEECMKTIFKPTIEAMNNEGRPFKGVLYFGLMLTEEGPKVLEYNARFGDPETQVVIPCLENDLLEIFDAIIDEKLDKINITWNNHAAVCVVMASGGYPQDYTKGFEIKGLEKLKNKEDVIIFHAGTMRDNGKYYTNGGRVLGVTALGEDIQAARRKAYKAISLIDFENAHYRKDIGFK